jgi:hypothetical protein
MRSLSAIHSPFPPLSAIPRAVPLARRVRESDPIIAEIERLGPGPVGRWELIEALEPDLGGDRRDLRKRRAEVFRQIDKLVRGRRLVKAGRFRVAISATSATGSKPKADNRYQPLGIQRLLSTAVTVPLGLA